MTLIDAVKDMSDELLMRMKNGKSRQEDAVIAEELANRAMNKARDFVNRKDVATRFYTASPMHPVYVYIGMVEYGLTMEELYG